MKNTKKNLKNQLKVVKSLLKEDMRINARVYGRGTFHELKNAKQ